MLKKFILNILFNSQIIFKPFPQRKINGTPSHRSLCTCKTAVANVGVIESFGTVGSST